ncbi:ion transporter [Paragemmobacter aquarius]|uniref:ion transporter n=1 Tax=Paragemmobacter aquarius TaxID=2169400 RepID=UPI00131F2054|nr:ion transporter [Gemmobacter aquarius]
MAELNDAAGASIVRLYGVAIEAAWNFFKARLFMHDASIRPHPSLGARLHAVFHLHDPADPVARFVDRSVVAVVCGASLAAWFDLGGVIGSSAARWMRGLDLLATVLLTLEYLVRIAVARHGPQQGGKRPGVMRYILSPMALVDLVAILPAWLSLVFPVDLGVSRLLRLFRLASALHVFRPQWAEFHSANRDESLQRKVYNLLFSPEGGGRLHDLVERFLIWSVAASVLIVTLETVASLQLRFHRQFASLDVLIGAVFLLEYGLRLYSVPCDPRFARPLMGRLRYGFTPGALIDLLALLPLLFFFAGWDLALFPVLRLFRMLKLVRHSKALALIVDVVRDERQTLQAAVFILFVLTTLAGTGVYFAEHSAQPDRFSSIPASMYWAVVTLSSIGYGDVYPVTVVGRAMTMVLAIASLGMVALPAGIIATAFSERLRQTVAGRHAPKAEAGESVTGTVARIEALWRGMGAEDRAILRAMLDAEASGIASQGGRG